MINCNPETVSTDYDTSDRLYFEPLTLEDVLEVHPRGVADRRARRRRSCSSAARPPLGLAKGLEAAGVPILGTSPDAIDLAEERGLFSRHPRRRRACSRRATAPRSTSRAPCTSPRSIGYPVLVRPSYVLGGRGMEIVYDIAVARATTSSASTGQGDRRPEPSAARRPVPRRRDRDRRRRALRRHRALHRRRHGAHRGGRHPLRRLELHAAAGDARPRRGRPRARGDPRDRRGHRRAGPAQRAVRDRRRACSTCSRRTRARAAPCRSSRRRSASRSPRPRRASWSAPRSRELIAEGHAARQPTARGCRWTRPVAVKEAVLPFKRFRTREGSMVDSVLGPEMRSTGEVMGIDRDFPTRVREEPGGRVRRHAAVGHGVRLGRRPRQARRSSCPCSACSSSASTIVATEGTAEMLAPQRHRGAGRCCKFSDKPRSRRGIRRRPHQRAARSTSS